MDGFEYTSVQVSVSEGMIAHRDTKQNLASDGPSRWEMSKVVCYGWSPSKEEHFPHTPHQDWDGV
eukprot:3140192-Prorocentrum_lima.AAC.1